MQFIDNAVNYLAGLKNAPGEMQFAVFVDSNGQCYRIAEFMYYEDATAYAEIVGRRNLLYTRVSVDRIR